VDASNKIRQVVIGAKPIETRTRCAVLRSFDGGRCVGILLDSARIRWATARRACFAALEPRQRGVRWALEGHGFLMERTGACCSPGRVKRTCSEESTGPTVAAALCGKSDELE